MMHGKNGINRSPAHEAKMSPERDMRFLLIMFAIASISTYRLRGGEWSFSNLYMAICSGSSQSVHGNLLWLSPTASSTDGIEYLNRFDADDLYLNHDPATRGEPDVDILRSFPSRSTISSSGDRRRRDVRRASMMEMELQKREGAAPSGMMRDARVLCLEAGGPS